MSEAPAPTLFLSGYQDIVRPEPTLTLAREVAVGRTAVIPAGHGDYLGTTHTGRTDRSLVDVTLGLVHGFLDGVEAAS